MHRGSTLLEIVLYIALASTILFAVVFFYFALLESRAQSRAITEVEQQGLSAVEVITAAIRGAEVITAPSVGVSTSSLTLDVIDVSKDPTVIDIFSGALRITEGTGVPVSLTSSAVTASSLTFSNYSRSSTPGTVRVQFTLTYSSPSAQQEYIYARTFVGSASLRHP